MKKKIVYITLFLVLLDQLIKFLIYKSMNLYDKIVLIPNFLDINYLKNDGGAFSILSGNSFLFIGIAIIAIIFIIRLIVLDSNIIKLDFLSYSLILSGTIGNLLDRVIHGSVIDYIHFTILNNDMPVFNFADIFIVFGTCLLIYNMLFKGDL